MKDCYHILCQAFFLPAKPGIRKRQAAVCEIGMDSAASASGSVRRLHVKPDGQEKGKPGF